MNQINYTIYHSVQELPADWDAFGNDSFLQITYLKAQETATPQNMDYFYVAFYNGSVLIAKTVIQRVRLVGKEMFPDGAGKLKEELLNLLNLNLLCVGNIKLTGEHAWEIKNSAYEKEFLTSMNVVLKEIRQISKKEKIPIKLLLIKDFLEENTVVDKTVFSDYEKLSVQPNMVFTRDKNWTSFEDYLSAMKKKYRTRARRAFKKAEGVVFKELSLEELMQQEQEIYSLYLNVYKATSFSMYKLPQNFFTEMKREKPQSFRTFGGYLNRELVCFYTIIENTTTLEAGFLGYNKHIQQEKQLYLNMLYKMIEYAIKHQLNKIDFSRTALEIKSSVGAEPYEMYGLLKHTNPLMNKVLRSTFKKFYQPEQWEQRHPFK